MKHFIWLAACLGDLVLVTMMLVVLWGTDFTPAGWFLVLCAAGAWKRAGGLDNWRPSIVRQYFRKCREIGL